MTAERGVVKGISLALVPFDAGREGWRMGAGPDALLDDDLRRTMQRRTGEVQIERIRPITDRATELRTTFDLHHRIAEYVQSAVRSGSAPIVVAGDCNATVGVVAGLGAEQRVGVLWLDAHADFETPETDGSGYLDGQGLAMLTGRCWRGHTQSLRGFVAVPERRVLLVGARDLGHAEELDLEHSDVQRLAADAPLEALNTALVGWAADIDLIHLHVDVDVIDSSHGRANDWASAGGMSPNGVLRVIRQAAALRPVASAVLASWDPAADPHQALREPVQRIALSLMDALSETGMGPGES